jgi:uncharacterized protein (DUF433 family)
MKQNITVPAASEADEMTAMRDDVRERIVSDPNIMGGTPTIRGTRISARSIFGRVAAGDTVDSILEDYPYLDRETVEAAAFYGAANPPRGRPAGKPKCSLLVRDANLQTTTRREG